MKGQKLRQIILTALTVVMLCFCVLGCSPEVTDNKKREEEEAQRKEYELLECKTNFKLTLDRWFKAVTTEDIEERKKISPTYPGLYWDEYMQDYLREIIERRKEEIDAAEDMEAANIARSNAYHEISDKSYCYKQIKDAHGIGGLILAFKITGEYEDIKYEITTGYYSDGLFGNSNSGPCWEITSNTEDIEVNCIIDGENHWDLAWNLDTNKSIQISEEEKTDKTIKTGSAIKYKNDWVQYITHLDRTTETIYPENIYFNFIVKYKGEIIGYTVVDMDSDSVLKTVNFAKEDAKRMTKEKVRGYIEDAKNGINGESRDGIKTVNNTVFYDAHKKWWGFFDGKEQRVATADGESEFVLTMPEDIEEIEFIMITDGAFIEKGEEKKRIEVRLREEVTYKKKTEKDEYLEVIIKYDGQIIGYALFVYRNDISAFEYVKSRTVKIPESEKSFCERRGFEIDEEMMRSFMGADKREREKD